MVLLLQSLVVITAAILLSLGIGSVAAAAGLASSLLAFASLGTPVLVFLYVISKTK